MRASTRRFVVSATLAGAGLLVVGVAGGAQRPGHEIDQKQVCLECHDLEGDLQARVVHAPVEAGECSTCHNPHVARFKKLLRERPGPLCASCHVDVRGEGERQSVHAPVAEGRCADCHEPHGSAHEGLLVTSAGSLCETCHEATAEWRKRRVQHPPFAQGECSTCHDPHSSDAPALLAKAGAALCAECHTMDAALRGKHQGYPVEQAACQQCHDPHASAQAGLFRETLHAPFEAGDCTLCHAGPGSADPFAPIQPLAELCGACHEETVEAARHAPFPHVPAGGGSCVSCHNPHTGDGAGLLKSPATQLCLGCHDPGGASSGQKGRFVTHSGFECTTCHQPHGGQRPLLFVSDSVEMCGSCHSHEHGVVHPLGEDNPDPRTGNPMTCRSCHGIHRAEGDMYLFEADQRMLCVGCHKDLVGR